MAEICRLIAPSCLVCSAVSAQSLYLRSLEPDGKLEPINLSPLFADGTFVSGTVENVAEEDLYVSYALELDDGEAMSLALAHARNLALATDERKARRLATENASRINVISTAEIVHAWAKDKRREETISVVRPISGRARFRPPDSYPLANWWNGIVSRSLVKPD
jgi:hypothetical protein